MIAQDKLPEQPLSGMINKHGSKVRLHFRSDSDQLWIGTKGNLTPPFLNSFIAVIIFIERTEKIPLGSIRSVVSEPIPGHQEYHIMVRYHCDQEDGYQSCSPAEVLGLSKLAMPLAVVQLLARKYKLQILVLEWGIASTRREGISSLGVSSGCQCFGSVLHFSDKYL